VQGYFPDWADPPITLAAVSSAHRLAAAASVVVSSQVFSVFLPVFSAALSASAVPSSPRYQPSVPASAQAWVQAPATVSVPAWAALVSAAAAPRPACSAAPPTVPQ